MKPALAASPWMAAALFAAAMGRAEQPHDPMRPPMPAAAEAAVRESAPVVSAVRSGANGRIAVFNGSLVRAGDLAGSYRILEILEDGVRYMRNGAVQEVRMAHEADIKKPASAPAHAATGEN
jgi:hypothetical protein